MKDWIKFSIIFTAFVIVAAFAYFDGPGVSADSPDPAKAKAAFIDASKVFFSARCSNCHPAGDFPTQGDEMTQHFLDVVRGEDGKGAPGQRCDTCHQEVNLDGDGLPPGAPNWHMPPPDHKMPFQGITAGDLCRQIKDPAKNGGKQTPQESINHISADPLVLWAWSPGNNRPTPPLSHEDFVKKMNEWVENGADCPE